MNFLRGNGLFKKDEQKKPLCVNNHVDPNVAKVEDAADPRRPRVQSTRKKSTIFFLFFKDNTSPIRSRPVF